MKKLFLALVLAIAAMISVAPSQVLLADDHHQNVYGSFYTIQTGTEIPVNGSFPFEITGVESHGLKILDGNILIKHKGDYLVTYGVALDGEATTQLHLNGVFVPGTQQPHGPDLFHPLSTIIHVSASESILSIISLTAVALSARTEGDTTVFITISKLN